MVQRSQRQPSKVGNKYFGDIVLKLVQITPIANLEACNAPPSLSLVGQVGQDTESKFGLDSSPADKKTWNKIRASLWMTSILILFP